MAYQTKQGLWRCTAAKRGSEGSLRTLRRGCQRLDFLGYFSQEEELSIFKQAREPSKTSAILFIVETAHTEFFSLKFTPTSYSEIDNFVILEDRSFDPRKAQINTTWTFYEKHGNDLKFVDKVDFQLHIYSLSELVGLLEKAGWETIAHYGSLSTLQPMTPLTSLNIVAKAV